jgi:hypothetical protein
MTPRIMYLELKSEYEHDGPAWIGKVGFSRTGTTIYFNNKAFKKFHTPGFSANYYDLETQEEYWISGVKKNGKDRHWAGNGKIKIDGKSVVEYLSITGQTELDEAKFEVITIEERRKPQDFFELENKKME